MTSPAPIPLANVDLDGVIDALNDGHQDYPWYLHTGTGDVRPGGADWDSGYEPEELEEQGWIEIVRHGGGRGAFEDMELFADAVGDLRIRDLLLRSLEGKGAFRRFRDTKYEFIELKDPWADWSHSRESIRAIQWLLDASLIDELEADAAIGEHRTAAATALDSVRTLGGAVFELADVASSWASISAALAAGQNALITNGGVPYATIAPITR